MKNQHKPLRKLLIIKVILSSFLLVTFWCSTSCGQVVQLNFEQLIESTGLVFVGKVKEIDGSINQYSEEMGPRTLHVLEVEEVIIGTYRSSEIRFYQDEGEHPTGYISTTPLITIGL